MAKTPTEYYRERCEKEYKQTKFFTRTVNTGILNQVLAKHGLKINSYGEVRDDGIAIKLFKDYLENVVLPDIEQTVGIRGIKVHNKPTHLTMNLFKWRKAEIANQPTTTNKKGK